MDKVEVTIDSDGNPVPVQYFTRYFYWLRACYVLALDEYKFELGEEDGDVAVKEKTAQELASSISRRASSMSQNEIYQFANKRLPPEQELLLQDIMRRNPFEVVFLGIGIALTAALIVSGGKFELSLTELKIQIPPLGEGIASLRKAFGKKK